MPSLPEILDRIRKSLEKRQSFIEGDRGIVAIKPHVKINVRTGKVKTVQIYIDAEDEYEEK